jgi:hypothetical protein
MNQSINEVRKAKTVAAIREIATDITVKDVENSKLIKIESGHLTGTIAGQKVHGLTYHIRYWNDGTNDLFMTTRCGTARHARGGGHYVNYYTNLGRAVTCAKCAK